MKALTSSRPVARVGRPSSIMRNLLAAPYDERLRLPDRERRMNAVRWMILAGLISLLTSICVAAQESDAPKPAQSTNELRQQLEKILKDTHTNGVSVAIVHKN